MIVSNTSKGVSWRNTFFLCLPSIQKIDYLFIFLRLYFVIFNLSINDCNEKKG